jgi:hypothetical protein
MTRIIEHRQDAAPDEEVFELRVFQLRDSDVRGCVVPADLAVDLNMMADMSEPVAQAYLDALALCETESVATLWVHDPLGLFPPPSDRSSNCDAYRLTFAWRVPPDVVRIEWEHCGRAGSYRRDGLVARFGADIALPDRLLALAQCERRRDMRRAVRLSGTPN